MNILKTIKKNLYFRQHPETALRYLPIVDLLKKEKLLNTKILEVGSGSYGITPYLKREVTGVDTSFPEPEYPLLKQVKSTGEKLPFKDDQFEVLILSDVLEHIPANKRKNVLEESVRVASRFVIISGPFGKDSFAQDKKLADYSKKKTGNMHPFFKEHLENGLPEIEDIKKILEKNKKVVYLKVVGQYLNLSVREKIMKIFITENKLQFYFYLKGLMPIVPILRRFNSSPCYRTVILMEVDKLLM